MPADPTTSLPTAAPGSGAGPGSGHTPGPLSPVRHSARVFDTPERWDNYIRGKIKRVACDDCDRECTAGTTLGPPTVRGEGDRQMRRCWECDRRYGEALARLHNAAPALLAACEALLARFDFGEVREGDPDYDAIVLARKAASEARGGSGGGAAGGCDTKFPRGGA